MVSFRAAAEKAFASWIACVVLFGSPARGDDQPDADYEVGIFLYDLERVDCELQVLAEIEAYLLLATGAAVNALPLPAQVNDERTV